jgi:hypothetical protein
LILTIGHTGCAPDYQRQVSIKYQKEKRKMKRNLILLLVVFSFVVAGLSACASLSEMTATSGSGSPELPNSLGTPLGVDLSQTPAAKGKIGDSVGAATATPGEPNPVGHSFKE